MWNTISSHSAYIDIFANANPGQRGNLHPQPRVLFITELISLADGEGEKVRLNRLETGELSEQRTEF